MKDSSIPVTVFTGGTVQYETNSLSHYNCTLVDRNTCNNRHKFYDLVKTFMNSQLNFGITGIIMLESIKSELCHNPPVDFYLISEKSIWKN